MTRIPSALAFVIWLGLLGAGLALFMDYDTRPGAVGSVAESRPSRESELLYFVHPHCPCARAGLTLLSKLDRADLGRIRIVFVVPDGAPADWRRGASWDLARAVPRADLEIDEGGHLARSYGVRTSGHTLIYESDGQLQFSGGITGSRSPSPSPGDGSWDWKKLVEESPAPVHRPVVGCPLFDDADGE